MARLRKVCVKLALHYKIKVALQHEESDASHAPQPACAVWQRRYRALLRRCTFLLQGYLALL